MTLDDLLDYGDEFVHKFYEELGCDELVPFYHLFGDKSIVIECPWSNDAEKEAAIALVCFQSRENHTYQALFISEAWAMEYPAGVDWRAADPPSQQPKRIECVQIVAMDKHDSRSRSYRMIRDKPGGKLLRLEKMYEGEGLEGRITEGIIL